MKLKLWVYSCLLIGLAAFPTPRTASALNCEKQRLSELPDGTQGVLSALDFTIPNGKKEVGFADEGGMQCAVIAKESKYSDAPSGRHFDLGDIKVSYRKDKFIKSGFMLHFEDQAELSGILCVTIPEDPNPTVKKAFPPALRKVLKGDLKGLDSKQCGQARAKGLHLLPALGPAQVLEIGNPPSHANGSAPSSSLKSSKRIPSQSGEDVAGAEGGKVSGAGSAHGEDQ
jgi:hypothetical protein